MGENTSIPVDEKYMEHFQTTWYYLVRTSCTPISLQDDVRSLDSSRGLKSKIYNVLLKKIYR